MLFHFRVVSFLAMLLLVSCGPSYTGQEFAPNNNNAFVGTLNIPYDTTGIHVTTETEYAGFHVRVAQQSNTLSRHILPPGKKLTGGCYWRNAAALDNVCSYGQHARPTGDWRYVGAYPTKYAIVVDGKTVGAFADAPQFFPLPAGRRDIKVLGYYCAGGTCNNNQVMASWTVEFEPGEKKTLHREVFFGAQSYKIDVSLK